MHMKSRDLFDFILLAALWGASFLFMRVGAPEFGPIALIGLRVLIAAVCLWPLVLIAQRTSASAMRAHAMPLAVVGVSNSALPFTLLAYASLSLTAGFNALVNATVPLWAAVIGVLWLRATMDRARWLGLALGVIGIAILTWGKVDFKPGGSGLAIVAGLVLRVFNALRKEKPRERVTAGRRNGQPDGGGDGAGTADRGVLAERDAERTGLDCLDFVGHFLDSTRLYPLFPLDRFAWWAKSFYSDFFDSCVCSPVGLGFTR
jgi:uncharacterized membrane protein